MIIPNWSIFYKMLIKLDEELMCPSNIYVSLIVTYISFWHSLSSLNPSISPFTLVPPTYWPLFLYEMRHDFAVMQSTQYDNHFLLNTWQCVFALYGVFG